MNIITIIRRLHRESLEDTESLTELLSVAKRKLKLTMVLQLIILIITIIAVSFSLEASYNYNKLEESIRTEFGPQFTDKKVFMAVDIKTANIKNLKSGLVETDIGVVEMDKHPKSTVIIVFTDLEGKLRPIDDLSYSNEMNSKTFEYVSKEYDPGAGATLIESEYDRLRYKDYLKSASELSSIEVQRNIRQITMIISILMCVTVLLILLALLIGIKRIDTEHYKPYITLFGTKQSSKKVSIEKQGIGSENAEKQHYERDEEDAILSEGGQFTGKFNKE